ncbi:MAG TPA: DUF2795 domain-containing protein [Micromonosporaceae bacterium]|nr:DUF2795 domain-containing protein [Micromonosporaceae bacterium]
MERGSSKHGPRLDEVMAQEVQGHVQGAGAGARAQEWHEPEPAGEDQPEPTAVTAGRRGGAPAPLTADEVEQRSRFGRYLPMSALPGDRETLRRAAADFGAPDDVLAELDRLPDGREYQTVAQVWAALGHANEEQRW